MYPSALFRPMNMRSHLRFCMRRFCSTETHSLGELVAKSLVYSDKDGYVMKSPYAPVSIPDVTIDQYVWKNLSKWQNRTAIECGITGRKYTYANLRDHCAALAIRLRRQLKLQANDIVGICLPNVPGNKQWIQHFTILKVISCCFENHTLLLYSNENSILLFDRMSLPSETK